MTSYTPEQYADALIWMPKGTEVWSEVEGEYWAEEYKDIIRQALAAMADPQWVLVPREPTKEMTDKGIALAMRVILGGNYRWDDYAADYYKTMIAAAPAYGEKK